MLGEGPLASIDNLTMLYTRRHLHEVANAEAQRAEMQGRPFGVILLELAGVAEVNKLRGYAAGDEKIRTTARTLQTIAARRQATACRYSRCRLALVVPDSDEASTELLATETAEELGDGARTTFSLPAIATTLTTPSSPAPGPLSAREGPAPGVPQTGFPYCALCILPAWPTY